MEIAGLYSLYIKAGFKVYTDTRKPVQGAIFFALKGPGFNGNKFLNLALDQGASWAVGDEKSEVDDERIIIVEDALKTLQDLASFHRNQCKADILGIGGSNGKTTTKELLKKVLDTKYRVHATPGNFNNHIGVPLTLLSMPVDTQIALIELGTNQKGDIEQLCKIAQPDFGIITNIGKEHLEGFGSIEAVANEESHLYNYILKNNGTCFINQDDKWLSSMSKRFVKKVDYSVSDFAPSYLAPKIKAESKTGVFYSANLAGEHNLSNMAATRVVGLYFAIKEEGISKAIGAYRPKNMRSEWKQTENNLIFLDAYNANPSSMEVAINTLKSIEAKKKIAILGDMFELGSFANQEHKNILEYAQKSGFEKIITAGEEFSKVNSGAESFKTTEELIDYLQNEDLSGYTILIKGSRGMKLEGVLAYL